MNAAIRTLPSEHAAKPFIAPKLFTAKALLPIPETSVKPNGWKSAGRASAAATAAAACGLNPYMSMLGTVDD